MVDESVRQGEREREREIGQSFFYIINVLQLLFDFELYYQAWSLE